MPDHDTPEVIALAERIFCEAVTQAQGDYKEALREVAYKLARMQEWVDKYAGECGCYCDRYYDPDCGHQTQCDEMRAMRGE